MILKQQVLMQAQFALKINNKIYWIVGGLPKHQDRFQLKKLKKILSKHILLEKIFLFLKQIKKRYFHYKFQKI